MPTLKPSDLELTQSSDYLTDEYYEELLSSRHLTDSFGPCADMDVVRQCEALVYLEARLLDRRNYKAWLELYTRDCVYWVPQDDEADIRSHANLIFDDRRRMEDRVLRLISKFAHTLKPDRFFQRSVSNVEAWQIDADTRRVLASQVVYEYRRGHELDRYVYRSDHTLRRENRNWKIAVKRCVMVNMDAAVEPPTLL